MYPKLDSLKAECLLHKPYIVCITKTWLSEDISNHELHIPGYCVIRLDRSRHGGGVLMYISDLFTYNTVFVGNQTFECIIVSFGFLSCKFCVCLLYRPPSSQGVLEPACIFIFKLLNILTLMFQTQVTLFTHSCLLLLLVFHCIRLLMILLILILMEIIPSLT